MNDAGSREGFGSPPLDEATGEGHRADSADPLEPAVGETMMADATAPADGQGTGEDADDGAKHDDTTTPEPPRRRRRRSFWRELPVLVVVALALALVIKTYAIQAFYIPSGSMQNTLQIGDRVLINKLVYDFRNIHRGDIVVFDGAGSWDLNTAPPSSNPFTKFFDNLGEMVGLVHGEDDYIKRVIGLPGDHVACCDAQGRVTVNGAPLTEQSYLYPGNVPSQSRFSIVVPPSRLWVMGDHRGVSYDSRGHVGDPGGGTIPESSVLGRAFVIIWPPSRWGFLPIPSTFQQAKLNASSAAANDPALNAALARGAAIPVRPSSPELPLAFGFAGAVPLTLLQRFARSRWRRRRDRRP